jgi:MFS transporter, AAHS family, 4-hydroxybenzoate transporter
MVGSLVQGRITNAWGGFAVLLFEFTISFGLIGSLAFVVSFPFMIVATFLLGCFAQGAQAGLNALAATYYPFSIRSTGIGWALGIGRIGSIVGPILGGIMMSRSWPTQQIFLAGAMPTLIAASAVLVSRFFRGDMTAYQSKARP